MQSLCGEDIGIFIETLRDIIHPLCDIICNFFKTNHVWVDTKEFITRFHFLQSSQCLDQAKYILHTILVRFLGQIPFTTSVDQFLTTEYFFLFFGMD